MRSNVLKLQYRILLYLLRKR